MKTLNHLNFPYGIAFTRRREMIITQRNVDQVLISVKDQTIEPMSTEKMAFPKGIAIDEEDNIYVSSEHKLQKLW